MKMFLKKNNVVDSLNFMLYFKLQASYDFILIDISLLLIQRRKINEDVKRTTW